MHQLNITASGAIRDEDEDEEDTAVEASSHESWVPVLEECGMIMIMVLRGCRQDDVRGGVVPNLHCCIVICRTRSRWRPAH